MSTAIPWLPTTPSSWPDLVGQYIQAIPKLWPKRMYRRGGGHYLDLEAVGEVLGAGRLYLQWVLMAGLPHMDTGGVLLHLWEEDFGLVPAATVAKRVASLEAKVRLRGTVADAVLKAIFLPAFPGATGLDDLTVTRPNYEELHAAGNTHQHAHVRAQFSLHIHSTAEDLDPDLDMADRLITACQPAVAQWTVGRYKTNRYGVDNAFWNRALMEPT